MKKTAEFTSGTRKKATKQLRATMIDLATWDFSLSGLGILPTLSRAV